jgi:repressor LexA
MKGPNEEGMASFTHRQGQFLAFIHLYCKLHRQGPAELDLVNYFRVTPPSVHQMMAKLAELGLITRKPGVPRSADVAIPVEEIPRLEPVEGPPW